MFDILFFLPGRPSRPTGGYRVVYEYAKRLDERGFTVGVIHAARSVKPLGVDILRMWFRYMATKIKGDYTPDWFELSPGVKFFWVPHLQNSTFPASRTYVATAWDTALPVFHIPSVGAEKIYLIQGIESWSATPDELIGTYKLGLKNVAISEWLQREVISYGVECLYIPNGLDHNSLFIELSPEVRSPYNISALYHRNPSKGSLDALNAVRKLRNDGIDVNFTFFGAYLPPDHLMSEFNFIFQPDRKDLRRLLNESSIFLSTSYQEGWGLTTCEAMQCGCAVIATDIGGHREFIVGNSNCLIYDAGNVDQLYSLAKTLIFDRSKRVSLSIRANYDMLSFDWNKSVDLLVRMANLDV